jgi:hypothetical protein
MTAAEGSAFAPNVSKNPSAEGFAYGVNSPPENDRHRFAEVRERRRVYRVRAAAP